MIQQNINEFIAPSFPLQVGITYTVKYDFVNSAELKES